MKTFGVDRYSTNELTTSVLVHYDPRHIQKHQLIEILADVPRATSSTHHDLSKSDPRQPASSCHEDDPAHRDRSIEVRSRFDRPTSQCAGFRASYNIRIVDPISRLEY
jgi:hypothetical protein